MPTDPAAIVLPANLRPSDGRFGSGPSKVRPEAVDRLAADAATFLGTSHRRDGVRSVVHRIRAGLADLFTLPDGYEVLLGNGGTTAFWDAAAFGLIERRSEHLAFGEFTSKFAAVDRGRTASRRPGGRRVPSRARIPSWKDDGDCDAFATAHNETSTGVMMDLQRPGNRAA